MNQHNFDFERFVEMRAAGRQNLILTLSLIHISEPTRPY